MSWKILITAKVFDATGRRALELLRQAGCAVEDSLVPDPVRARDLVKILQGYDAVLASVDEYSADVLSSPALRQLKIISRWGVGFDSIDIPSANQNGIVVAFTPGLLNEAVADYTFALLLSLARRVIEGQTSLREGKWDRPWGTDLSGKTFGIVGYGRIGEAVARRARGFNMRILAYDLYPRLELEEVTFVSFDQLLAQSDFISLHAASTPENRGLMDESALRKMKPEACLINTARGPLIDEPALVRALKENWIAGAALDVFTTEPLPLDHPFRDAPNLRMTPHQSSYGRDTGEKVSLAAAQAILDLLNKRKPEFVVNPEVFDSPALRAPVRK